MESHQGFSHDLGFCRYYAIGDAENKNNWFNTSFRLVRLSGDFHCGPPSWRNIGKKKLSMTIQHKQGVMLQTYPLVSEHFTYHPLHHASPLMMGKVSSCNWSFIYVLNRRRGFGWAARKKRAQTRCVIFLMYIFILFLLHSSQRWPTKANTGQQRPTKGKFS